MFLRGLQMQSSVLNVKRLCFLQTDYALQFTCGGVDVDIMLSYDWDMDELNKGGYNAVYDISTKTNTKKGRQWWVLVTKSLFKNWNVRPLHVLGVYLTIKTPRRQK